MAVDLKPGPVQLIVNTEGNGGRALIQAVGTSGGTWYYRFVDEPIVRINLPVHPERIIVVSVGRKIASILQSKLTPPSIPHVYPQSAKRPYHIDQVRFEQNLGYPGPARMFTNRPVIEYNPKKIASMPEPIKRFVLLHELGHQYHDDEQKTDAWAFINFINMGWLPSQATYALIHVLGRTPDNVARMLHLNKLAKYISKHGYN